MKTVNILSGFLQELPLKKIEPQKEEEQIHQLQNNSETWQLLQEVYQSWQAPDKEKLTQKSKLLKTIKKSCQHGKK